MNSKLGIDLDEKQAVSVRELALLFRLYIRDLIAELEENRSRYQVYNPADQHMKRWRKGMLDYYGHAIGLLKQHESTCLKGDRVLSFAARAMEFLLKWRIGDVQADGRLWNILAKEGARDNSNGE